MPALPQPGRHLGGHLGPGTDLVVRGPPSRRCCAAYAEVAPYNVVIVELDDEPSIRFCGNVVETPDGALDQVDPHSLEIGLAVEVCFAPEVEGIAMPRWRRATTLGDRGTG